MKILIQVVLIFVIAATLCICALKPEMHKAVLVYNSDYKLVPEEETVVETKEIPVQQIVIKPEQKTVKSDVKTQKISSMTDVKNVVSAEIKKPVKSVSTTANNVNTTSVPSVKKENKQNVAKNDIKVVAQTASPKVLTQKEEEIAWNVWRSTLQNQIMNDVNLPALPNGIIFRFSFDVDKYGKITNIYTYSDNPSYTPYAIQYIAPVIRSYQGKSILNFPSGSSRVSTEFKGGWRISSTERLSTPQDYNDYEKVKKVSY